MTVALSIEKQAAARGLTTDQIQNPTTDLEIATQESIIHSLRLREGLSASMIAKELNINIKRVKEVLR